MNPHSILVNQVLLEIGSRKDLMVWKNATGVTKIDDRVIRYGLPGSPDIIGILAGGRFLGLEIKTGSARQSPQQKFFQKRFESLGGIYIAIHSIEDTKKIPFSSELNET